MKRPHVTKGAKRLKVTNGPNKLHVHLNKFIPINLSQNCLFSFSLRKNIYNPRNSGSVVLSIASMVSDSARRKETNEKKNRAKHGRSLRKSGTQRGAFLVATRGYWEEKGDRARFFRICNSAASV